MTTLRHYGTPRHSGRYPWGSGENPYQRNKSFIGYVDSLKTDGLSEKEIANALNMSIAELRAKKTIALSESKKYEAEQTIKLKDKGYSNVAIANKLGISEGTVRNYLKEGTAERLNKVQETADMLKKEVAENKYIDIGAGSEIYVGVSREKLKASVEMLKQEGYQVHYLTTKQLGTGKDTTIMVLTNGDKEYKEMGRELYENRDQITIPNHRLNPDGVTFSKIHPPESIDAKRVKIRYGDEGGSDKDGVIEIRRGVKDLDMGESSYAQVRIAVNDSHYMKGMCVYSDDIPKGYDVVFNTNKKSGTPMMSDDPNAKQVLKPFNKNADNPFKATISRQNGALNIVNEEGTWDTWGRKLSSQFLSKQAPSLARKQLELAKDMRQSEFEEIMGLTNSAVRKKLLDSFAESCDSDAVHLKAAAMPRQSTKVILPCTSLKENEVYAPTYRNGEKVVLIRHPHGGIFEIPELTVNNKNPQGRKNIKDSKDAIGINPKTAIQLSGADFDGDTVIVIPNNRKEIKTSKYLDSLKNFDPKEAYPGYEGMKVIKPKTKQKEMGSVSNLITDMTIKGAPLEDIERAVKHSMVVIDSEKHKLDYRRSYEENGIAELKKKWQGKSDSGAATLVSQAKSQYRVPERTEYTYKSPKMTSQQLKDWAEGKRVYKETGRTYTVTDSKGNTKQVSAVTKSTKMAEAKDARKLSSGTVIEDVYADYANSMKALANQARRESRNIEPTKYDPQARKDYADQVASLKSKLNVAKKNAPLERKAQTIAKAKVDAVRKSNPDMDKDDIKKLKNRALAEARVQTGAHKNLVDITDLEWEAIQKGAVSHNTLLDILNNADSEKVKQLATPKNSKAISDAKLSKARSMIERGYTQAEVADALGVSVSTLNKAL